MIEEEILANRSGFTKGCATLKNLLKATFSSERIRTKRDDKFIYVLYTRALVCHYFISIYRLY